MIQIRAASAADRAHVGAMFDAVHRHYFHEALPGEALAASVADVLERGQITMLLAFDDTLCIGCATFAVLQPSTNGFGTLFMKDLFVVDTHRGRGLGRRLLAALAEEARTRGCSRLDWTAEDDNPGALRLYDALGAERVREKVYFRVAEADLDRFIQRCDATG